MLTMQKWRRTIIIKFITTTGTCSTMSCNHNFAAKCGSIVFNPKVKGEEICARVHASVLSFLKKTNIVKRTGICMCHVDQWKLLTSLTGWCHRTKTQSLRSNQGCQESHRWAQAAVIPNCMAIGIASNHDYSLSLEFLVLSPPPLFKHVP